MNHEILTDEIISKIILINGQKLQVFEDGRVDRWFRCLYFKTIKNTDNNYGYNQIKCNGKHYYRHRIIGFAFLGLDIDNVLLQIDHQNGDRLNNNVFNLRIVSNQGNHWNRTKTKGYYWHKRDKKYGASINVNGKIIHLGYYDNEEDAHNAYLEAKKIHHIIPEYNPEIKSFV
jgi:hypothetical protein